MFDESSNDVDTFLYPMMEDIVNPVRFRMDGMEWDTNKTVDTEDGEHER